MRKSLRPRLLVLGPIVHPSPCRGVAESSAPGKEERQRQPGNIVPGDLQATLEAHRASNRAPFRIHKIEHLPAAAIIKKAAQAPKPFINNGRDEKLPPSRDLPGEKHRLLRLRSKDPVQRALYMIKQKSIQKQQVMRKPIDSQRYRKGSKYKPLKLQAYGGQPSFKPWRGSEAATEAQETKPPAADRKSTLDQYLKELDQWMILTPEEREFRKHLSQELVHSIRLRDDDVDLWTFGSIDNGLATTMSDIDIGFWVRSIQKAEGERGPSSSLGRFENRRFTHRKLDEICTFVLADKRFINHEIVHARHPLVRMLHAGSDLEIQIVATNPQPVVNETIALFLDEYPRLRPVYFCVKAALAARGLDEPRTGGVGSYTLFMMIVAALKSEQVTRRDGLTTALMHVLKFWSDLNTTKHCVSVHEPQLYPKRLSYIVQSMSVKEKMRADPALWARHLLSIANEQMPYLLSLQDPADLQNDLGKGVYRIMDIRANMRQFHDIFKHWLNGGKLEGGRLEYADSTPMDKLFGQSLLLAKQRRSKFQDWMNSVEGKLEWSPEHRTDYEPDSVSPSAAVSRAKSYRRKTLEQTAGDSDKTMSIAEALGMGGSMDLNASLAAKGQLESGGGFDGVEHFETDELFDSDEQLESIEQSEREDQM